MIWLQVNECRVNATGAGAQWWTDFRLHGPERRFTVINTTIGGEVVNVECDDRAHAESLMAVMIERGVPAMALKIVRKNEVKPRR